MEDVLSDEPSAQRAEILTRQQKPLPHLHSIHPREHHHLARPTRHHRGPSVHLRKRRLHPPDDRMVRPRSAPEDNPLLQQSPVRANPTKRPRIRPALYEYLEGRLASMLPGGEKVPGSIGSSMASLLNFGDRC